MGIVQAPFRKVELVQEYSPTFSPLSRSKSSKERNSLEVLGVSTSAEVDKGRCPLDPYKLLKKFDQNFIMD